MSTTDVLTMDSRAIDMLLSNHELFSEYEVRLAVKRKVELDKTQETRVAAAIRGLNIQQQSDHRNMYDYDRLYNGMNGYEGAINSGRGTLSSLLGYPLL